MTRPYAEVIGDPIAHSKSPLIHNFWLGKLGIDADYRACHVKPEELADYFTRRRGDAEWRGCNVTIPHKVAMLSFADDAGVEVRTAANVMARREAKLVAFNTDVDGLLEPLGQYPLPTPFVSYDPDDSAKAAIAQIIGAGGAAQAAIQAALDSYYLHIEIYNRSVERAQATAAASHVPRGQAYGLDDLRLAPMRPGHPFQGYECRYLIINASPMGMAGQPPVPIDLSGYPQQTIVFDMVYTPLETPLLRDAKKFGLIAIDGLQMLVAQAAPSFELFFGRPAPREHDAELRALLIG